MLRMLRIIVLSGRLRGWSAIELWHTRLAALWRVLGYEGRSGVRMLRGERSR